MIDVFIDRSFGHNFDATADWDRAFVDRVHAFDEQALRGGILTPTHMLAVLGKEVPAQRLYARGLSPERSVRAA